MKDASKLLLALAALACSAVPAGGQPPLDAKSDLWIETRLQPAADLRNADPARFFRFDLLRLNDRLDAAGWEGDPRGAIEIELPSIDGGRKAFAFERTQILSDESAREHPEIRTYRGRAVDPNDDALADLVTGKEGILALVLSRGEAVRIESDSCDPVQVRVFRPADREPPAGKGRHEPALACLTPPLGEIAATVSPRVAAPMRREIQVALAATQSFLATDQVIAAYLSQASMVFEKETGVALRRAAIFLNRPDCPSNGTIPKKPDSEQLRPCFEELFEQNRVFLDDPANLGEDRYDLGHVLSGVIPASAGRVEDIGNACTRTKAGGVSTGRASDPFDPKWCGGVRDRTFHTFLHEVGHQLGATHTFSRSANASCNGSVEGSTAFEPGSGTTLMSYAGRCPGGDIVAYSDLYFHAESVAAIQGFVAASDCGAAVAPIVPPRFENAGTTEITIPRQTPFALSKQSLDPGVQYTWEQFDAGEALFRSFPATSAPRRTFPKDPWNPAAGETLPTAQNNDGEMTFRVAARAGSGGVAYSDVLVNVAPEGPFKVLGPSAQATWLGLSQRTVHWVFENPASGSGLRCDPAKVSLTRTGQVPIELPYQPIADGVRVQVPAQITANDARILVECGMHQEFFERSAPFKIRSLASPIARFTVGTRNSRYPQVNVAFDARTTTDPAGIVQRYVWTIGSGGGEFSTPAPFAATFDQPGRYPVRLDLTNDGDVLSTASDTVVIPFGHATVGPPSGGGSGSFALYVGNPNGIEFCSNPAGASAQCNFPQNACGRITLWIRNLGTGEATFRLTLGGGAKFSNGATTQSFNLFAGETFDFSVDDPCP